MHFHGNNNFNIEIYCRPVTLLSVLVFCNEGGGGVLQYNCITNGIAGRGVEVIGNWGRGVRGSGI